MYSIYVSEARGRANRNANNMKSMKSMKSITQKVEAARRNWERAAEAYQKYAFVDGRRCSAAQGRMKRYERLYNSLCNLPYGE